MFLGISVSTSRCMTSLHMSGILPYYERIFLRSIIAARVNFTYRHLSGKKMIKSNREKNLVFGMASKLGQDNDLQQYVSRLQDLDE